MNEAPIGVIACVDYVVKESKTLAEVTHTYKRLANLIVTEPENLSGRVQLEDVRTITGSDVGTDLCNITLDFADIPGPLLDELLVIANNKAARDLTATVLQFKLAVDTINKAVGEATAVTPAPKPA